MTYFPDLELCYYHSGVFDADSWSVPLLTIGYLEHPHRFPRGVTPEGLLPKLDEMVHRAHCIYANYNFRGVHSCSTCIAEGLTSPGPIWSQENIFVPGASSVYVAPGGIIHYIEAHSYLPAPQFIEAVLACPEYGSPEYQDALRIANAGHAAPLRLDKRPNLNPSSLVADVMSSVEWYRRVFGFEPLDAYPLNAMEKHALLSRDGGSISLARKDTWRFGRTDPVQAHLWLDGGLDELFQRVQAMGVEIIQPPENRPHRHRVFKVADPDGNIVWVTMQLPSTETTT